MPHGQIISPVLTDAGSVQDFGPGGVLNQLPGLKATGDAQRLALTVMNEYKDNNGDRYNAQHPNAVSDGDGHGRGEDSGQIGTREDQLAVQTALYSSGNKYKPGMGYDNFNYPQQYW